MKRISCRSISLSAAALWCAATCLLFVSPVRADGGYFSERALAVSADQRAILVHHGDAVSLSLSTGYTGEGRDFAWIIPTPALPDIKNVTELSNGERVFQIIGEGTSPTVQVDSGGGCFPAGTEVLTAEGPRAIETIGRGTRVISFDMSTSQWTLAKVTGLLSHRYSGDIVTIEFDGLSLSATGNHPVYVLQGDRLLSRPVPGDVPAAAPSAGLGGRWVEARHLKKGDRLTSRSGGSPVVLAVTSRRETTRVFNLEVEGRHSYAVTRMGILVHNKGEGEGDADALVTVHGTSILAHYAVSVLGSSDAGALIGWLKENGYRVSSESSAVLQNYIDRDWSFVAVKLNPEERRPYRNEFLPPIKIEYRSRRLVYPLLISSISTAETAAISLHVIAESTVSCTSMPAINLRYDRVLVTGVDPEQYVETCIGHTVERAGGRALAVLYRGENWRAWQETKKALGAPSLDDHEAFFTRFETRLAPEHMRHDLEFVPDVQPAWSVVELWAQEEYDPAHVLDREDRLHVASQLGDLQAVQDLLETGVGVNKKDGSGRPAILIAALSGHLEVVRALIDAGVDPDTAGSRGETALMAAAGQGDSELVDLLLEAEAEVQPNRLNRGSALASAAGIGRADIVRTLLEARADPRASGNILFSTGGNVRASSLPGWSPIVRAAAGGHLDIVRILLNEGAHPDGRERGGTTALQEASRAGHSEIVNLLLAEGAEVNRAGPLGTALSIAAQTGRLAIADSLLKAGADPNRGGGLYGRPLCQAARYGYTDITELLIEGEADVNFKARDGWTALMRATNQGRPETVQVLLRAGADPDLQDGTGETALHRAIGRYANADHARCVELLLAAGADPNIADRGGFTPLMEAARGGHAEIAIMLIAAGADLHKMSKGHRLTALKIAKSNDHYDVVAIIHKALRDEAE